MTENQIELILELMIAVHEENKGKQLQTLTDLLHTVPRDNAGVRQTDCKTSRDDRKNEATVQIKMTTTTSSASAPSQNAQMIDAKDKRICELLSEVSSLHAIKDEIRNKTERAMLSKEKIIASLKEEVDALLQQERIDQAEIDSLNESLNKKEEELTEMADNIAKLRYQKDASESELMKQILAKSLRIAILRDAGTALYNELSKPVYHRTKQVADILRKWEDEAL